MTRQFPLALVLSLAHAMMLLILPETASAQLAPTQNSSVYTITDGQVRLKSSASDNSTSPPTPKLTISPKEFENSNVYRNQLLLEEGAVQTTPLEFPAHATTITVTARSRPAGDIFPRLRITLVTEDNNRHRVYEGYWQTISMESRDFPLQEWVRGKKARLSIELLNPGRVEEQRTWYYHSTALY